MRTDQQETWDRIVAETEALLAAEAIGKFLRRDAKMWLRGR